MRIGETAGEDTVVPTYPVIQYGHVPGGGDAVGSGFVYRGKLIPALRGKYVFTDISTGRLWYADYAEMQAADDGDPRTTAALHEIQIAWDDPDDSPDQAKRTYASMFDIVRAAHAELCVSDLDESARFYCDVLGFALTERTGDALYLRAMEDAHHHSLVLRRAAEPGVGHLAFRDAVHCIRRPLWTPNACARDGPPHRLVAPPIPPAP